MAMSPVGLGPENDCAGDRKDYDLKGSVKIIAGLEAQRARRQTDWR
jgi:hypothetical protein